MNKNLHDIGMMSTSCASYVRPDEIDASHGVRSVLWATLTTSGNRADLVLPVMQKPRVVGPWGCPMVMLIRNRGQSCRCAKRWRGQAQQRGSFIRLIGPDIDRFDWGLSKFWRSNNRG